ncbi:MAG: hypothetical protein JWO45_1767, partial [Spartobacteria bacterium]|nr:hypothetical protein [Spartobacteria bacterium]
GSIGADMKTVSIVSGIGNKLTVFKGNPRFGLGSEIADRKNNDGADDFR